MRVKLRRLRRLHYTVTICMILQSRQTFASLKQALHRYRTSLYEASWKWEHVDDVTIILLQYLDEVCQQVGKLVPQGGEIPNDTKLFTLGTTVTQCYLTLNLQVLLGIRPTFLNLSLLSLKRYCIWAVDFGLMDRRAGKALMQLAEERRRYYQRAGQDDDNIEGYWREDLWTTKNLPDEFLRERLMLLLMLYEGLQAKEICLIRPIDVEFDERGCTLEVRKVNRFQRIRLARGTQWALEAYLDDLDPEAQFLIPARFSWEMTEQAMRNEMKRYLVKARPPWVSEQKQCFWFGCRMIEYALSYRLARILGCSTVETTMLYIWKAIWELIEEIIKRFEPEADLY